LAFASVDGWGGDFEWAQYSEKWQGSQLQFPHPAAAGSSRLEHGKREFPGRSELGAVILKCIVTTQVILQI